MTLQLLGTDADCPTRIALCSSNSIGGFSTVIIKNIEFVIISSASSICATNIPGPVVQATFTFVNNVRQTINNVFLMHSITFVVSTDSYQNNSPISLDNSVLLTSFSITIPNEYNYMQFNNIKIDS